MSAVTNTPENLNALTQVGFRFQIKKLPHVNFFAQNANIPGVSTDSIPQPNPMTPVPHAGDHISWNELEVTFQVDEDLRNYIEIHNWIRGLTFPEDHDEYAELSTKNQATGEGLRSDASLIIQTSSKNPNIEVIFEDVFPIALSDLDFNTTDTTTETLKASVQFAYTQYKFERL